MTCSGSLGKIKFVRNIFMKISLKFFKCKRFVLIRSIFYGKKWKKNANSLIQQVTVTSHLHSPNSEKPMVSSILEKLTTASVSIIDL